MEPYIRRELDRIQKMVEDLRRELERRDVQLGHRILFDEKRAGEVPSPGKGDADRVLRADGTWGAGASSSGSGTNSGSNIGVGVGVYASSSAGLMTFRSLTGSGGISVTLSGSSVVISGSVGSDSGGSGGSFISGTLLRVQTFTADGTYTPTPRTRGIWIREVGGGGGGAGVNDGGVGGGGAAGAYVETFLTFTSTPTGGPVAIGTGGVGGSAGSDGSSGIETTVLINGVEYFAGGGAGGATSDGSTNARGGVSNIGDSGPGLIIFQDAGGHGLVPDSGTPIGGSGGSSPLGAGGQGASWDSDVGAGENGTGFGAGGGGASSLPTNGGYNGGDGTDGVVIIYEYGNQPAGGSSGSFGADALTFSYFAAGTEGTSFVVSLPAVLETTDYSVFMTNAGSTGSFGSQLPANTKTTGSFRVNVTAPPSAGDRFDFLVIETPGNQWNLISGSTGGGDITNATNLGSGSVLFASKSTSFLQFKSLYAGPGVTLSSDASHVTISADGNGSLGIFGTGRDGTLTFDGSSTVLGISPSTVGSTTLKIGSVQQYILTRDIYCEDLTIDSGVLVFTDGYRVFVRGTLTLNGYVGQPGVQGTIGGGQVARTATVMGTRLAGHPASPSSVPSSAAAPFGASNSGGAAGTNGTAGNNGNAGQDGVCYKGGGGGGIGNGLTDASIAGGTVTVATAAGGSIDNIFQAITGRDVPMSTRYTAATGGGYGAGAGLTLVGWGGGGGSPVAVIAYRIVGSGVVTAAGGDGSPGNDTFAYATNGGGGGGGGGGSFAVVVIGTGAFPTVDVSGGTGAPGGVGSSTTGGKGGDGGPGLSKLFRMGA